MHARTAGCLVGLLIGISFGGLLGAADSNPPAPMWGPYDFYAHLTRGWGFGPTNQTNPTITVTQFETVSFRLFSADGLPHTWLLDVNGNGFGDAGEPESATFSSSSVGTFFSFVASQPPGSYDYICGIHGVSMRGTFVILPGNAPPTVTLTNPDGVSTNRWTGGFTKRLSWTMNDPDGLPSQLLVFLNYTSSAGNGVIAGPPTLPLGAVFYDWSVPLINANDAHVIATVIDPGGAQGTDDNAIPVIDSTWPTVLSTVPVGGSTNVSPATPIQVTYSELMDQPSAQAAVSLCRMPGCVAVTLNFVSWSGNTVTFQPSPALAPNSDYQGTVAGSARDASNPGNTAGGAHVWSFRTTNTPPSLTVGSPTVGLRWTGGSSHTIQWTPSDAEDLPDMLTVWINYSATGNPPTSPVLGPVPGTTTTYAWTVPMDNTATAKLFFAMNDTGGATASFQSAAFSIDSTPPGVNTVNPSDGQVGVATNANIVITFTEPMNTGTTASPAVVSLETLPSGPWVPMSYSWDPTFSVLTANPLALLAPLTQYRLHVNATATDASDPGNTMGVAYTSSFTTSAAADLTPPAITNVVAFPSSQTAGGFVEITADVTDDVGVSTVAVNVTIPGGAGANVSMALKGGSTYSLNQTWSVLGTYTFVIWASDAAGNWASAPGGSFEIVPPDTTAPVIAHTPQQTALVGDAILLSATVTDDDRVVAVWLDYVDVAGTQHNVSMNLQAGVYSISIPAQSAAGTVRYRIWAVDPAGNWGSTSEFTVAVSERGTSPPSALPWLLLAVLILVAVLATAFFLVRRRRRGGEPEHPPPP